MGKRPQQAFFQIRNTDGQRACEKRCSTSLIIREVQNKTTVRYHLIPVRMAIIKKTTNIEEECKQKGIIVHYWWEFKLVQPLWKTVLRLLKKLKIELRYDPTIPLLGIYI